VSGTVSLDKAGSDSKSLVPGDFREGVQDKSAVGAVPALPLKGPGATDELIIKYQALRSGATCLACCLRSHVTPGV
jgi:hypothetical protein